MAKVLNELKSFMMRGNVVDMAVGVIIGGAFGKIVSSLVSDVIMPPIGMLLNGVNFSDLKFTMKEATVDAAGQAVAAVTVNYGVFIQTILDFVIIATVIFFAIKLMNSLQTKQEEAPATPPAPTKEETLLTEIRDLLKEQNDKK
ncbi:large-conductance mechanosensitive channel protein MscL [Dysgonomonas sp. 520]|uniref:large-conductance mechanosensitive channel protein MscL n=1 Tax=Dysgonomonas sp. 520 TaxID=2302931 RepID=UPI0013D75467|nr:large-conductance mechanosensitive channel protein MscL [Dysgonomonas sp. 520]NDW10745.1 large-conductance mechanosensitive channel protein MscL [Dysgonomonas sp. 520]